LYKEVRYFYLSKTYFRNINSSETELNSSSSGAARCPIVVAAAVLDSKIQSPSKSA